MSVFTRSGPRRGIGYRALTRVMTAVSLAAAAAACSNSEAPAGPRLPIEPSNAPQLRKAAFIADVNMRSGKIVISAPNGARLDGPSLSISGGKDGPELSILAGDAITLIANNYRASAVGAFVPGKVRVSFDVSILNKLQGYALITPTFPEAPAAEVGPVLFPFEMNVTTTSGGTSIGGDGTEVIVDLPSYGEVVSSGDWNGDGTAGSGAPHNFFNDRNCVSGDNDCFRWEAFGAEIPVPGAPAGTTTRGIPSLATSSGRVVGFDVDPTVGQFRARLIIAADLMAATPPVGDLTGTVSSPQRGSLGGVQIAVGGSATNATTSGDGVYSFTGLPIGPRSVSIVGTTLPSGCTSPAAQEANIVGSSSVTVDFTVTCTVPAGTVQGAVSSSLGGTLSGVTAVVTPTGLAAQPGVLTDASGLYTRGGVPVGSAGTGEVALANLPANCSNPGGQPYSGLTDGGSVTLNITVSCTPPPQGYAFGYTIVSSTGSQVVIEARIDMGAYNDPNINGTAADDIGGITMDVNYSTSELQFVSAGAVPGSALDGVTANGGTAGRVSVAALANSGVGGTGLVGILRITFNRVGSGTPAATTTVISDATSANQELSDLLPRILVTEGSIPRP